jgi:YafQ family addiction module toxin component
MYDLDIKPTADKIFQKLAKRNKKQLRMIFNKIQEIRENPTHQYKFLRKPLQNYNRVHIDKHFVLIFKMEHKERSVVIYYFDHHENVYKWRPQTDNF